MRRHHQARGALPRIALRAPIDRIVDDYIRFDRKRAQRELAFYAQQPSLAKALELAALAVREDGKRCSHQRRIPRRSLAAARRAIERLDLEEMASFEELHDAIEVATKSISRIGPLTVYDTALRLGAYLGLEPRMVFLHAGTRSGAVALGLGNGAQRLPMSALPPPFRHLKPREAEDCLSIYKGFFAGAAGSRAARCGPQGPRPC